MISLAITLALVAPALSAPFVNVARQTCMGQSCVIADLSGSTGTPYTGNGPVANSTDAGDCCIIQYNPSATAEIEKLNPGLTCPATKRELGIPQLATSDNLEKRACTPYTLIFSRGTSEPGTLGIVVGPSLSADLEALDPGQWTIIGVAYDASDAGDACLGLPGGAIATQDIDAAAAACPDTKIVVSGYSQGAAVSHIGVANASPSAVKQVAAVVVFGDPFDGAPIKGFSSSKIKTFCATGDEVCDGLFVISAAHLSYGADTGAAAAYIQSVVA